MNRLTLGISALVLAASAAGQVSYDVTTLADNGPTPLIQNSLRWALWKIISTSPRPSTVTINIKVGGTIVVKNQEFSHIPSGTAVTMQAASGFPSGGRLTIDARGTSTVSIANGLVIGGNGSKITVPLKVLAGNRTAGITVLANNVTISDFEAIADKTKSLSCLTVAGSSPSSPLTGFVIGRLIMSSAPSGLVLRNCRGAQIGSASGSRVVSSNCANGFFLDNGSQNKIPHFEATACSVGVVSIAQTELHLGSAAGPRSLVTANTNVGVAVQNTSSKTTVENADVRGNKTGLFITGGSSSTTLRNLLVDQSGLNGIDVNGNATNTTIGPSVKCTNSGNGAGIGLVIGPSSGTMVNNSEFGPGNSLGLSILQGAQFAGVFDSKANQNWDGVRVIDATKVTLDGLEIRRNTGNGLAMVRAHDSTVRNSNVSNNTRVGIFLDGSLRCTVGPANLTSDNGFYGTYLVRSHDSEVTEITSDNNSASGISLETCERVVVSDCSLKKNAGQGIFVWIEAKDCTIGPGNLVEETIGVGIKLEKADNIRVEGNRILRSTAAGIGIVESGSGRRPHTLISNLIDGILDGSKTPPVLAPAGILTRFAGTPVSCTVVLSTIVNNVRGIHAIGTGTNAFVFVDSSILWNNGVDDYDKKKKRVQPQYSIIQNPKGVGTNSGADPGFEAPSKGDWSPKENSPAVDKANPALLTLYGFGGNSEDATTNDRISDCKIDIGAVERPYFDSDTDKMLPRGGKVNFDINYPTKFGGDWGVILLALRPPGSTTGGKAAKPKPYFGHCIPIEDDFWTYEALTNPGLAQNHINLIHRIPANGLVKAAIDYNNIVPPGFRGLKIFGSATAAKATPLSMVFSSGTIEITLKR